MARLSPRRADAPEWADFWIAPERAHRLRRLQSVEQGDQEDEDEGDDRETPVSRCGEDMNTVIRIDDLNSAGEHFRSQWQGQEELGDLERQERASSDDEDEDDDEDDEDEDEEEDDRLADIDVEGLFAGCHAQMLDPGVTITEESFEPLLSMEKRTLARCLRMSQFVPPEPEQYYSTGQMRPNGNLRRRLMVESVTNGQGQINSWKRMANGTTRKANEKYRAHFKCLCRLFLPNRPFEWLVTQLTWNKQFFNLDSVDEEDDSIKEKAESEKHCRELRKALFPLADPYELSVAVATYKRFWVSDKMRMDKPIYFDEAQIPNDNVLELAWAIAKMKHFWPLIVSAPKTLAVLPFPGPSQSNKLDEEERRPRKRRSRKDAVKDEEAEHEDKELGTSASEAMNKPSEQGSGKVGNRDFCEDLKSKAMRLAYFDGDESFKLPEWLHNLAVYSGAGMTDVSERKSHLKRTCEAMGETMVDEGVTTKSASPSGDVLANEPQVNRATSMPIMSTEWQESASPWTDAKEESEKATDGETEQGDLKDYYCDAMLEVPAAQKRGRGRPRKVDADGEPTSKRALAEKRKQIKVHMALATNAGLQPNMPHNTQLGVTAKVKQYEPLAERPHVNADSKWRNSITGGDEEALAALNYLQASFARLPGVSPRFKFLGSDAGKERYFLLTKKGFFTRVQKFDPQRHLKVDYDGNIISGGCTDDAKFEVPQHILDQLAKWKAEQEGVPEEQRILPKMINPQGRPRQDGTSRLDLNDARSSRTPDCAPAARKADLKPRNGGVAEGVKLQKSRMRIKSEDMERTLNEADGYKYAQRDDSETQAEAEEEPEPCKEIVYETLALQTKSLGAVTVVVGEGKSMAQLKAKKEKEAKRARRFGVDQVNITASGQTTSSSPSTKPYISFSPPKDHVTYDERANEEVQPVAKKAMLSPSSVTSSVAKLNADADGTEVCDENTTADASECAENGSNATDSGRVLGIESPGLGVSPADAQNESNSPQATSQATIVSLACIKNQVALAETLMEAKESWQLDIEPSKEAISTTPSFLSDIGSTPMSTPSSSGSMHSLEEQASTERRKQGPKRKRTSEGEHLLPVLLTRSMSPEEQAVTNRKVTRRTAGVQVVKPPMPSFWQRK